MQCPNCGNTIEGDFGVVTCSKCQAVFSVGMDGEIQGDQKNGEILATQVVETPSEEIADEEVIQQDVELSGLHQISDFANADVSVAGPISYHLVIEGLDNKELYQEVQHALSEPRLMIDAHSVMKTVRMGRLEIKGLNPVKASRIVSRLAELPLKVSWRQSVYDN